MKKKLLAICSVVLIFAVLLSACGSEMGGLRMEFAVFCWYNEEKGGGDGDGS